jgi:hypothetical protein
MSVYKQSARSIQRELSDIPPDERSKRRLQLDLESLLIGPTCGSEARRLVALLLASTSHDEVARTLLDIATRYQAESEAQS